MVLPAFPFAGLFYFINLKKLLAMMQCLTNIVGVTTSENPCIVAGLTVEQLAAVKLSTSGLYMDELPGGIHLKAVANADATKTLYPMAMGARDMAIKSLENDLVVALNATYSKSRKNFVGQIGRMSYAQTLATFDRYQGLRMRPVDYSDAVITLNRINLIVNLAATFTIYLYKVPYKSAMGGVLASWPVTTLANAFKTIDVNPNPDPKLAGLKLPLTENGEAVEYHLFYDKVEAGGAVPKDTKMQCSICERTTGPILAQYLQLNGVDFADTNNLQNARTDDYSHGFILDVSVKCDSENLFCGQYSADDAIALTMAYAVWFKAGELLIEDVLKSTDINRYTTMDKERLWGKRNHFRSEYQGRIQYLAQSIDITASNCYVCREQLNQPFTAGIFS